MADPANPSLSSTPFPNVRVEAFLGREVAGAALAWLRDEAAWTLRVEEFYEQHETSLLRDPPPGAAAALVSPEIVDQARRALESMTPEAGTLALVDVCAHRLTAGQTIRIHNDFLGGEEETHRILVQLNDGWTVDQGGLLMLFEDDRPESLADVVVPAHRSAFGFEISPSSHHAVSTVRSGERFTIVYAFRSGA